MATSFCAIVYGESGVGKTPFAGTLAQCELTSPCLFIDVDRGTMSLAEPLPVVVSIESWDDLRRLVLPLKERRWDALARVVSEFTGKDVPAYQYRSVVIDSGTELEYRLRRAVVMANDTHGGIPDQSHYLITQEKFKSMYRALRDIEGISLVMTAGIRELKDEVSGIIKHYPDFQPSLCHDLVRMTDFVFFMSVNLEQKPGSSEREWVKSIQATLTQRAIARSRSPKIQGRFVGDTFSWKDIIAQSGILG